MEFHNTTNEKTEWNPTTQQTKTEITLTSFQPRGPDTVNLHTFSLWRGSHHNTSNQDMATVSNPRS